MKSFTVACCTAVFGLIPLFGVSAAYGAVLVPPQGPVTPDSWASCSGCTPVGSGIFATGTAGSGLGFVYSAGIFTNDPLNPYGSNDLDFVYSFLNNATSTDSISRITAANFTGFNTDVGYFTAAAFPGGAILPNTVDRSSPATVGFTFSGFAPGDESLVLVIKTNASAFDAGTISVFNSAGQSGTVMGFAPVPEPNLVWPLAGAMLIIATYRRVRFSKPWRIR